MVETIAARQFIAGQWETGQGDSAQRRSPADDRLVWDGNHASDLQAGAAIAAAREAFAGWAQTSVDERVAICQQFAKLVEEGKEDLARLIAVENGKPLWEARTEVAASIAKVATSVEMLQKRRSMTTDVVGDFSAVTRYRPHGVMFVIGPFNFPSHVPGGHIIPALLAGNTVVFKPSELVPATGQWLAQAWEKAGIPPGVFNLVHGDGKIGQAAVDSPDVDGILFTGSQKVGTHLHRALAGQPHRVLALEMGGNNPLVVHDTEDIRGAATTVILSAYISAGQRCTCARRLIVTGKSLYDDLINELSELIPKIQVGLPFDDPQPFIGPLISAAAAEQMLQAQSDLVARGATEVVAMKQDDRSPALVTPGLLAIGDRSTLTDQEHFGPLLTIQQADSFDDAIDIANDTQYGLAAGLIGQCADDFEIFCHRVRAGVINWNRQTTGASGKLPFGGVGQSGNHHPSGAFAIDCCSYPIASLESGLLSEAKKVHPGLPFQG